VYGNNYPRARSPSPLRSSFKVDPNTGEVQSDDGSDNNDDDPNATWGRRSQSPNPSISQFASSFAQRVGSFVSSSVGTSAVSSSLPTDEEIEREAERDRERSRREAEQILIHEAEERRLMEEKVYAMLHTTHTTPKQISPARSQSMPSFENPSPTPSQRDNAVSSWWSAAKTRLTPTKEPLTAAQQVIQETKEKEKREKKDAKKDRKRSADWPAVPENKYTNPTLLSLVTPPKPSKGASLSAPPSPTPGAQGLPSSLPPSLAPSPLRTPDSRNPSPSRSPSREPPPLYTQFTDQGSLDVPGTLLVIARRFEKLEKWTVGHVRALEERMGDVERWLVEKESEKGADGGEGTLNADGSSPLEGTVNQMQDELMEMQGRIGELGREMAKFATTPGILSTMPSRVSAQAVSTAPQTNSSFAIHAQTSSSITVHSHSLPPNTPQASVSRISSYSDLRRRDSVSPPFIPPSAIRAEQPRSRLPYPTGDYTSPPGSVIVAQGALSPPRSPPTSNSASASPAAAAAVRSRPVSVAGFPAPSPPPLASAPAGLPPSQTSVMLVAPQQQSASARSSSISPTPRKRYTVALGEPIMKPRMSVSPPPISVGDDDDDDDDVNEENGVDHTIGRSAGRYAAAPPKREQRSNGAGIGLGFGFSIGNGNGEDTDTSVDSAPRSPRPPRPRPHTRTGTRSPSSAQSMASSANASANSSATGGRMSSQRLLGHGRALSIDRDRAGALPRTRARSSTSLTPSTPSTPASAASSSSRFRDPLVVRREESEARAKAARPPPKVVAGKPRAPVGEMVAYFDKS
jgi:hypothetical protein